MEKQTNIQNTAPKQEGSSEKPVNNPPQKSGGLSFSLLFGIFLGIILLFIGIFYALMLWALFSGDVNNPIFEALGIKDQDLQSTLLIITHTIFGILVVISLINFLIGLFRGLVAERKDVRRGGYFKRAGIAFVIMGLLIAGWAGLYVVIRDARTESLEDTSLIRTEPAVTSNLSAPIQIKFNLGDALFRKIDRNRVKQINWDFDGDNQYDASGPEVFYTFKNKGKNNGNYTARAQVVYSAINGAGEEIFETSREIIIANESVAAEILSSTNEGPAPLRVNFNAGGSYDPDGSVVYYEWDFNEDGIYDVVGGDVAKVEHVFQKIGKYKVKLRVRGSNSDYDETETIIDVTNPEQNLKARITSSQSKEGFAPYEVILSGDSSFSRKGRIIKYTWFIQGEDEVIPSRTMKWKFSLPGEYLVRLVIENDLGEKEEDEILIKVKPPVKKSNLIIDTTPSNIAKGVLKGVAPFEVTFDSNRSELLNAIEWRWDFDSDGIVDAYDKAATHVFRKKGSYEVKLTMVDTDGDEFTKILPVEVESSGVKANITATPIAGTVPLMVRFDGSSSSADEADIINYIWEFPGNEPIPYGAQISYEFPVVGVYEVKLTVLTDTNETARASKFISVRAQPLEIDFTPSVFKGAAPLRVDFDSSLSKGDIAEYRWDFGDGIIDRVASPTHVFTAPGQYNVTLQVKDRNGIVDRATKTIEVE